MVRKVSQGTFGMVFEGINKDNNDPIAIKIEKQKDGQTLDREVHFMTRLQGLSGIPKLYWSGLQDGLNVMILVRFKSVTESQVQRVYFKSDYSLYNYLKRDLKPENIVIGKDQEVDKIFLIDFGISKFYKDNNNKHIDFQERKAFVGTTRYASISSHKGQELGRKDDLEQLMYILIYLSKGSLPWQNLATGNPKDRTKAVGDAKMKISIQELCKDLPDEFSQALDYVKKLSFRNDPNYAQIIIWFKNAAKKNNIVLDSSYEWNETQPIITQLSSEIRPRALRMSNGGMGQRSQSNDCIQLKGNLQTNHLNPPEIIKKQDTLLSKGSFNSLQNKYTPSMNVVDEQNEEWNISKDNLISDKLMDLVISRNKNQEEKTGISKLNKQLREPDTNENIVAISDFDVKGSFQSSEFKEDISLWLRLKFLDHSSDLSKGLVINKFSNKHKHVNFQTK